MEKALNLKEPPKTTRNKEEISQLIIYINLPIDSLSLIISNNPKIVNIIDNKKETILSYAMRDKKEDICLLILTSKVLDLSYQDKNGNSYLHLAVLNKLEKITQMLIEKGININRQNKNGNTALHLAYIKNLETMILILKNNKADRTIRNKDKKLAEDLKNNKKKELAEPASLGRTTKAKNKKKNKSNNNNSKLTAKSSTTNNDVKNESVVRVDDLINSANGIDNSIVETDYGFNKCISVSRTLEKDTSDTKKLKKILLDMSDQVGLRARRYNLFAKTVAITYKTSSFKSYSHGMTLTNPINNTLDIYNNVMSLFDKIKKQGSDQFVSVLVRMASVPAVPGIQSLPDLRLPWFKP